MLTRPSTAGSYPGRRDLPEGIRQTSVRPDQILALVDPFLFSSNVEVKRDALYGLASLSKTEENKEIIGQVGGVAALSSFVFGALHVGQIRPSSSPAAVRLRRPASAAETPRRGRGVNKMRSNVDIIRLAASTLAHLLTSMPNYALFRKVQGVEKTLEVCMNLPRFNINYELAKLLYNLSYLDVSVRKDLLICKAPVALFHLANNAPDHVALTCFQAMKKLSVDEQTVSLWGNDGFMKLKEFVHMQKVTLSKKSKCLILEIVSNFLQTGDNVQLAIDNDLFQALSPYIDPYSYEDRAIKAGIACFLLMVKSSSLDVAIGKRGTLEGFSNSIIHFNQYKEWITVKRILDVLTLRLDESSLSLYMLEGARKDGKEGPTCTQSGSYKGGGAKPLSLLSTITHLVIHSGKKDVRHAALKILKKLLYKIDSEEEALYYYENATLPLLFKPPLLPKYEVMLALHLGIESLHPMVQYEVTYHKICGDSLKLLSQVGAILSITTHANHMGKSSQKVADLLVTRAFHDGDNVTRKFIMDNPALNRCIVENTTVLQKHWRGFLARRKVVSTWGLRRGSSLRLLQGPMIPRREEDDGDGPKTA